jgi:MFS family permease
MLPLLAKDVFGGGAGLYGTMGAVLGVGAVLATLIVASRPHPTKGSVALALGAFGVTLAVVTVAGQLWVELVGLGLAGLTSVALGVSLNASLQLGSDPAMRGRVIALFFLIANGSNVIGGPISGWIAQTWGVRQSLAVNAVIILAAGAGLWLLWARRLREPSAIPDVGPQLATA